MTFAAVSLNVICNTQINVRRILAGPVHSRYFWYECSGLYPGRHSNQRLQGRVDVRHGRLCRLHIQLCTKNPSQCTITHLHPCIPAAHTVTDSM